MNGFLKLSAPWCRHCKQMDAQLNRLGLEVDHIDLDVQKEYGKRYDIRSIPTIIKLTDGVEVARLIGAQTDAKLIEFIK